MIRIGALSFLLCAIVLAFGVPFVGPDAGAVFHGAMIDAALLSIAMSALDIAFRIDRKEP